MSGPLTPDDAEDVSGTRENFVGKVIGSSIDGLVKEALDAGYNESSNQYDDGDVPEFDHFAFIKPLDGTYDKNQNVFRLSVRSGRDTKWMTMMAHFFDIHGEEWEEEVDDYTDIPDFITGRVYEWEDIGWTEDREIPGLGITYQQVGRGAQQINEMLVPVREVTDTDELAELEEDTGGVIDEEVDI